MSTVSRLPPAALVALASCLLLGPGGLPAASAATSQDAAAPRLAAATPADETAPASASDASAADSQARVSAAELRSLVGDSDPVVRQVGEVAIRASDVYRVMDLAAPKLAGDVLREMVLTTLAELEARREGVDVPRAELEAQVEDAMAEQRARFAVEGDPSMTLEEFLLAFHGMTPEAYRDETRRMVLSSMLLDRTVRLQSLRSGRDDLQIILLTDDTIAQEVATLLAEGASFEVLAKRHSVHPSGKDGGYMPALASDVPVALVEGRQMLVPGEVLGPAPVTVQGKDFVRFVRLVERHPAREGSWAELRDEVEADLQRTPMNPDEVAVFEAKMRDRYRVHRPERSSPEPEALPPESPGRP